MGWKGMPIRLWSSRQFVPSWPQPRLSVSLLFVLSSFRFLESQGDGTDNTVVQNLLRLQNPFSCLGWLPGHVSFDVFVLHPIWSSGFHWRRVSEFSWPQQIHFLHREVSNVYGVYDVREVGLKMTLRWLFDASMTLQSRGSVSSFEAPRSRRGPTHRGSESRHMISELWEKYSPV